MVAAGAHPKYLQAQMVHSSIRVTLELYGHLFPDANRSVLAELDRLIDREPPEASITDRGVTVEELTSEALQAYLEHEQASNGTDLTFIGLGDAENGFSARGAEERLEAEGFTP